MPFITQGKVNIKYLLIVSLIAAVAAGIIYANWNYFQKEITSLDNFTKIKNSPTCSGSEWFCQLTNKCVKKGQVCSNGMAGGSIDEHGCNPTAGYTWCEVKKKCLRTWEEACSEVACTMEAKLCPDGSSVGRTGPNCDFAECLSPKFEDYPIEENKQGSNFAGHYIFAVQRGGDGVSASIVDNNTGIKYDCNLNGNYELCSKADFDFQIDSILIVVHPQTGDNENRLTYYKWENNKLVPIY